jgi:2-C-methyl-D-erythritol 2,4-cyclodiphosphate synthase
MMRIGHGMDAHRLVAGRELVLCGVKIPHETGLLGHSDADVATHALMDALLGAAALGDIGALFPDTEERYRDACSVDLLGIVVDRLFEIGLAPANVDVTIVAQRPKLRPYIDEMRRKLAERLRLPVGCVSVKATTTEGMGYEGEEKGISAHAVCLLKQLTPSGASGDET